MIDRPNIEDDAFKRLADHLATLSDEELNQIMDEAEIDPDMDRPTLPKRLRLREICATRYIDTYVNFEVIRRWRRLTSGRPPAPVEA
jgi:hypothetical protein